MAPPGSPSPAVRVTTDISPVRRSCGTRNHARTIKADPVLGIFRAVGKRHLDRLAADVFLSIGGDRRRWRHLRCDSGGKISPALACVFYCPLGRITFPCFHPKRIRALTGLGLVIQQQCRLSEFAQPGKLDCPRCVVHALGQLNLKIARGDHVVTGLQRKRFALEQQRPRGLVFAVVGINPQHAILIFLKRIQRPEILKLDGIDDAVLAVDGEGVPGFPSMKWTSSFLPRGLS